MAVLEKGDLYKKLHNYMRPYFMESGIKKHFQVVLDHSQHFVERLQNIQEAEPGKTIDIENEMLAFTMGGISKAMLNFDLSDERAKELCKSMGTVLHYIHQSNLNYPVSLMTHHLPLQSVRKYSQALSQVQDFVKDIIENDERLETLGVGEGTLIRALRLAQRDQDLNLSDRELADQVVTVFFGGHETTAHLLTMAIYRLDQNPAVKEKLIHELQTSFEDVELRDSAQLSAARLPYLAAVIDEVLRIDSSIPAFSRDAVEDVMVRGFKIPKGSMVIMALEATHRLNEFWKNPEEFDPDRFVPGIEDIHHACGKRHPRAFSPFGVGDRACIGRFFSKQEVKTLLVTLLRSKVKLSLSPDACVGTEVVCTARMTHGMPMVLGDPEVQSEFETHSDSIEVGNDPEPIKDSLLMRIFKWLEYIPIIG
jgi:cytochrome P450